MNAAHLEELGFGAAAGGPDARKIAAFVARPAPTGARLVRPANDAACELVDRVLAEAA